MTDINDIARQFIAFYYETFSLNRDNLKALYRPQSLLTFEGAQFEGTEAIVEKLTSLPFEKVHHRVSTFDAQLSSRPTNSILVSVTGLLVVDDEQNPINFSQFFQLHPDGGSYYVSNDIFRLNYG